MSFAHITPQRKAKCALEALAALETNLVLESPLRPNTKYQLSRQMWMASLKISEGYTELRVSTYHIPARRKVHLISMRRKSLSELKAALQTKANQS